MTSLRPDFIASRGPLGLTLRLKRLADRLADDGRRLYEDLEVGLEPSWYALLQLLQESEALSVTQAAARLRLSHPSVVATSRKLESAGLLAAEADPDDRRRRVLRLSDEAREKLPAFEELWRAFAAELGGLIESSGADLLAALDAIEGQLDERPLDQRVRRRLEAGPGQALRRRRGAARVPQIRAIEPPDRDAVVHLSRELVRSADTYAFDPDTTDDQLWQYWSPAPPGHGYVAVLEDDVVGVFLIRPNHPGPGAHVANASYAVRADVRGIGLGRRMAEASLDLAAELGFEAMQFNIVVGTNHHAVRLWRSLGFRVVGTIPEGFQLPDGSRVSHHIMYRQLDSAAAG